MPALTRTDDHVDGQDHLSLITIQDHDEYKSEIPLILLHDGGGTIFNYYRLRSLGRPVFAIPDPKFRTSQSWTGGIAEMAETYCAMVKKKFIAGQVLLGGWSLGGFVALHMAHILAREQIIDVVGLVMIDASYLMVDKVGRTIGSERLDGLLDGVSTSLRKHMEESVKKADVLVATWNPPRWTPTGDCVVDQIVSAVPPPVVLIRAKDRVPLPSNAPEGVALVDYFRDDPWLGWSKYDDDLVKIAAMTDGHHFTVFEETHVARTSKKLKDACTQLSDADY